MKTTTRSASGTRDRLQQHRVDDGEDRGVGADAERSAATAASVNAGLCTNMRSECLRSLTKASMGG